MDPANCCCLIPARAGSKRIPGKNFRPLAGLSPIMRALCVARAAGFQPRISTDAAYLVEARPRHPAILVRPAGYALDTTEMVTVVAHAMQCLPGDPIVLVQPTQPLRRPEHLTAALALLTPDVDSVVTIGLDRFVRDGTAYVFWRKTVAHFGTIYGEQIVLLPIPAQETCPLDTPEDWREAERRLRENEGEHHYVSALLAH